MNYLPVLDPPKLSGCADVLRQLESMCPASGASYHFGQLYYETTRSINQSLADADHQTIAHTLRFQERFASYFLRCQSAGALPQEWSAYYLRKKLQPVQYQLLGINAHINGDMWQALVDCFDLSELEEYEKNLLSFQEAIRRVYVDFYDRAVKESTVFRGLHLLTVGLSARAGEYYLYRCRLQQVKLALLYYRDRQGFRRKLRRLLWHKRFVDHCICRLF